jgi:hypothetical protein
VLQITDCGECSCLETKTDNSVFCPCLTVLVGPDHHSAKKVLFLTMKSWKMKKSSEIMNLFEKNVGTPAILGKTMQLH